MLLQVTDTNVGDVFLELSVHLFLQEGSSWLQFDQSVRWIRRHTWHHYTSYAKTACYPRSRMCCICKDLGIFFSAHTVLCSDVLCFVYVCCCGNHQCPYMPERCGVFRWYLQCASFHLCSLQQKQQWQCCRPAFLLPALVSVRFSGIVVALS